MAGLGSGKLQVTFEQNEVCRLQETNGRVCNICNTLLHPVVLVAQAIDLTQSALRKKKTGVYLTNIEA